jgi:hypothetical protein
MVRVERIEFPTFGLQNPGPKVLQSAIKGLAVPRDVPQGIGEQPSYPDFYLVRSISICRRFSAINSINAPQ